MQNLLLPRQWQPYIYISIFTVLRLLKHVLKWKVVVNWNVHVVTPNSILEYTLLICDNWSNMLTNNRDIPASDISTPLTSPTPSHLWNHTPKHQAWTQRHSHTALRQCSFVPVVFFYNILFKIRYHKFIGALTNAVTLLWRTERKNYKKQQQ